jgi:hypothetical protein
MVPLSSWMAGQIEYAKKKIHFSRWKNQSSKRKAHQLIELIEAVKDHRMPLPS